MRTYLAKIFELNAEHGCFRERLVCLLAACVSTLQHNFFLYANKFGLTRSFCVLRVHCVDSPGTW